MFTKLDTHTDDPIEALFSRLAADTAPGKIDLGIGVFRDETGRAPVMQAVRRAERQLFARDLPKTYLSPLGNADYCRDVERLALGPEHPVLADGRIVSAQTPGAGSALRLAAELVHGLAAGAAVWASRPVWAHQLEFFAKAGMEIRRYRYYDRGRCRPQFDAMLDDLSAMRGGDLLLLHGCCHNPTGEDLTMAEWQAVTDIVLETGAVPFVDVAYQGFGRGIEEDVAGLRLMAAQVPQMLLAVSSSKSFGIYRERAGLLSIVVPTGFANLSAARGHLRDAARQLYFMAPDHGAAVVHEILATPELTRLWRDELDAVRRRVVGMREALKATLESGNPDFNAGFLLRQRGMFSCLPLGADEQRQLETRYHIYMLPDARVNVAAMNAEQSATLAEAFAWIRAERSGGAHAAAG